MLSLNFIGQSVDDIVNSLHLFLITDRNAKHRQTNAEVARLYGLLNSVDATGSLEDS